MRDYVLTLLAAAAATYLLTPLARRTAIAVGALHAARKRDVHTDPVPLLGGLAMYGGLVAGLLIASRLPGLKGAFVGSPRMGAGLLLAGGLLVLIGFADDRWGLGVFSKLAGQIAAGAVLIWSGVEVYWLPEFGGGPSRTLSLTPDQGAVITVLVVVVTINAVNFIDGLDGLAAGIVGVGAAAFFVYYYYLITRPLGLQEQTGPALVSAVLAGVCLGFLPHNFHPARIFMGDTGSMLIGLLLAYAPLSSLTGINPELLVTHTAYAHGTANRFGFFAPLLVPAAILLIPYADLLLAVVRRTRAGMSPFAADKKHLQHRLMEVGHSHRRSVLIMYLWAALFAGLVVWLSILQTPSYLLAGVTLAMLTLLGLLLFSMPRLRPWRRAAASAARKPARGAPSGRTAPALAPSAAEGSPATPGRGFLTAPPAAPGTPVPPTPVLGRTTSGGNGHTSSGADRGGNTSGVPGAAPLGVARYGGQPGASLGRHVRTDPLPTSAWPSPAPDWPAPPPGHGPGLAPAWELPPSPAVDSAPPWPPARPPAWPPSEP